MIEIRHLTKKYGENIAVNDLNLTLEPGNIYGFLGPNGAGKSTTMNIITGYIGATSGEVMINGHDINKESEKAKQCIGYLPELPPVYGDMKVLEYLKFVAELKQLNKHTQTADIKQVMNLTRLHPVKDRLIRNLSKGYRQRVGLAQALMGLPEIIILDEPTVGLDPKQIIEIRELIKSLKEKHTVILSSHILQEISAVCDHVFIISKGRLVASDTMEHLEKQMSGAQELNLTIKATEEQAEGLSNVDGVQACNILKIQDMITQINLAEEEQNEIAEETGILKQKEIQLELTAEPDADIRESVFRFCAENDMILLEMKSVTKSLEDVFLELTDGKEVQ